MNEAAKRRRPQIGCAYRDSTVQLHNRKAYLPLLPAVDLQADSYERAYRVIAKRPAA